jgi:hypothetical protein
MPINALMAALVAELEEGEIPNPLAERFTLANVWADLARLAGEELPAPVAALVDEPLGMTSEPVTVPEFTRGNAGPERHRRGATLLDAPHDPAQSAPPTRQDQPANDRTFADAAPLFRAWQAADAAPAAPAPAQPTPLALRREYTRGLCDGATIQTEEHGRVLQEHRELRAHLRQIWFLAHVTRAQLMTPNAPRRYMIEQCQEIIDRTATLVTRPAAQWPRVDTGAIDSPRPFDTERYDRNNDADLHAAYDRWLDASGAFYALTTPTGPRTPGYRERKAQMDAIRKSAHAARLAWDDYRARSAKYGL